jgi:hypothetical protein
LFSSCYGPSYPKEDLNKSLSELIFKETGVVPSVFIVGRTIYLDIEIDGLLSMDQAQLSEAFKKLQISASDIVRVVLSSDADIKFMVINAFSADKSLLLQLAQDIDDFKQYYYMNISQEDYQTRTILTTTLNSVYVEEILNDRHDWTLDEFVGQLIVANVGLAFMANPFLAEIIVPYRPYFYKVENGVLFAKTKVDKMDVQTSQLLRNSFYAQGLEFTKKYAANIKSIILAAYNGKVLFGVDLE